MGMLRGYALGIDEVRDIFGAPPELAARLRSAAASAFPPPETPKRGLLNWLGPLRKRDERLVVDPHNPQAADVDTLLSGRFCPPDRLAAAWRLLTIWLEDLSWGELTMEVTAEQFDELEFSLARAGLPSPLSLGTLLANDPQLPLLPPPGSSVGYAKHRHLYAVRDALSDTSASLEEKDQEILNPMLQFLDRMDQWSKDAESTRRPQPDLFVVWDRS